MVVGLCILFGSRDIAISILRKKGVFGGRKKGGFFGVLETFLVYLYLTPKLSDAVKRGQN